MIERRRSLKQINPPDFENEWQLTDKMVMKIVLTEEPDGYYYEITECYPKGVLIGSIMVYLNKYSRDVGDEKLLGSTFDFFGNGVKVITWGTEDSSINANVAFLLKDIWLQVEKNEGLRIFPGLAKLVDQENAYILTKAEILIFEKDDPEKLKLSRLLLIESQ